MKLRQVSDINHQKIIGIRTSPNVLTNLEAVARSAAPSQWHYHDWKGFYDQAVAPRLTFDSIQKNGFEIPFKRFFLVSPTSWTVELRYYIDDDEVGGKRRIRADEEQLRAMNLDTNDAHSKEDKAHQESTTQFSVSGEATAGNKKVTVGGSHSRTSGTEHNSSSSSSEQQRRAEGIVTNEGQWIAHLYIEIDVNAEIEFADKTIIAWGRGFARWGNLNTNYDIGTTLEEARSDFPFAGRRICKYPLGKLMYQEVSI